MPVELPVELPEDEESIGPLDASKAAGYEDGINPPDIGMMQHHRGDELLDSRPAAAYPEKNSAEMEADLYNQKNPLGYTITPPTANELDEDEMLDERPAFDSVR